MLDPGVEQVLHRRRCADRPGCCDCRARAGRILNRPETSRRPSPRRAPWPSRRRCCLSGDLYDLGVDQPFLRRGLNLLLAVGRAEISVLHDEIARLVVDRQMSVIGAADGDAVVAGGRLNPDIVVAGFAHDLAVGDAIQRHAAGDAEILGAGRLAQPDGALDQDPLGVVLDAPCQVLPMLHSGLVFPFSFAVGQVGLVERFGPIGNVERAVLERDERLDPIRAARKAQAPSPRRICSNRRRCSSTRGCRAHRDRSC